MAKKLWSIFTEDMDHCYFTGSPEVERHHVFGCCEPQQIGSVRICDPVAPDTAPKWGDVQAHERELED